MGEPGGLHTPEHGIAPSVRNRPVGQVVAATDNFMPCNFHQAHSFGFAGLEADGCSRWNIEAFTVGQSSVEL